MNNVCNICFQPGELYQIQGYAFPTCSKCSESITKGAIMSTFYESARPTMVPTASIITVQQAGEPASTGKNKQILAYEIEQALQNINVENLEDGEGSCPICNRSFNKKTTLLNHIRNHSAEKKYICNYCQKGFSQQANLRNHERIHTNERPYVCVDCGKAFTQITNLNNHRRLHTGERPYVCIEMNCGRSFAQVTNLNNHMKTHHKVTHGIRGFFCPQCPDKSFKQQSQLQQHMKIHGTNFGYSCTKCEEKFNLQSHLEQHMKQHGEYACTMCSSTFNEETLLKKHIQRHADGRYLTCPVIGCNEGFAMKNQLTKHMQMHHPSIDLKKISAAQTIHSCYFIECKEFFTDAESLGNHLRIVHGLPMATTADIKPLILNGEIISPQPINGIIMSGASFQSYQNQINLLSEQASTSGTVDINGKKVLSVSEIISPKIGHHQQQPDAANRMKTDQAFAVATSVNSFETLNRLVCNYCYNVFKTPQTLGRHVAKFHS